MFAVFSSPDLLHMIAVQVIVTVISVLLILPLVAIVFFTMIGTAAATAAAADPDAAPLVASSRSSRCSRWGCCPSSRR